MKEKCVEEGMKLARWLQTLGVRGAGVAQVSYEDYQRLSREAANALSDVDKMTCLSVDERSVLDRRGLACRIFTRLREPYKVLQRLISRKNL